jgi:VanZ family protein
LYPFKFPKIWSAIGCWLLVSIVALSLWPESPSPNHDLSPRFKLEQLLGYLVLMLWFGNIYTGDRPRLRLSAIFFSLAMCLELLQPLTPGRTMMITDVVINGIGISLGWILAKTFLGTCLSEIDTCLSLILKRPTE